MDPRRLNSRREIPRQNLFCSDYSHVFSAWSLWALSDVIRDLLPLTQFVKTHVFQRRAVKEHVLPCAIFDETKPLVSDSFDCPFSHVCNPILARLSVVICMRNVSHTDEQPKIVRVVAHRTLRVNLQRCVYLLLQSTIVALSLARCPVFVVCGERVWPRLSPSYPFRVYVFRMYFDSVRWLLSFISPRNRFLWLYF